MSEDAKGNSGPSRLRRMVAESGPYRAWMRRKRERAFEQLAEGGATAAAVGRALRAAQEDDLSPEESAWVDKIEALRAELGRSEEIEKPPPDRPEFAVRPVSDLALRVSKPRQWDVMMLKLIRELKPERCVELGTCIGLSAAYQAAALELNGTGELVTMEGNPSRAGIARDNVGKLDLDSRISFEVGRFQQTLDPVLEGGAVGYAFIDGHHLAKPTLNYFEKIAGAAKTPAIFLFDDVGPRIPEMKQAWRTICADERVSTAVELRSLGLCVVEPGAGGAKPIPCPLFA